jgi:hypothetical protein
MALVKPEYKNTQASAMRTIFSQMGSFCLLIIVVVVVVVVVDLFYCLTVYTLRRSFYSLGKTLARLDDIVLSSHLLTF